MVCEENYHTLRKVNVMVIFSGDSRSSNQQLSQLGVDCLGDCVRLKSIASAVPSKYSN